MRKIFSFLLLGFLAVAFCGCTQAEPAVYHITYHLDGGAFDTTSPTSFDENTPSFTLSSPTRIGYVFDGWAMSAELTDPQKTVVIEQGSAGSREYHAVWRQLAKLEISLLGVNAFSTEQAVYFGEIGDILLIDFIPHEAVLGSSVSWECFDASLGGEVSPTAPAPALVSETITVSFVFVQMEHSVHMVVYSITEGS